MLVGIYQIKDLKNCKYAFRRYDKNLFDINDYECVYSYFEDADVASNENEKMFELDDIFTKFQAGCIEFPEDFHGHSLSTSDVVALGNELYYCDSFGWEKI